VTVAAKKHTYRVTLPDGSEITRTTDRVYTHVVVYTESLEKRLAHARSPDWQKTERKNHAYYAKIALHGDGTGTAYDLPAVGEPDWRTENRARCVADAKAFIAKHPTVETYIAERLAEREDYAHRAADGGYSLAGWCGRADLAQKLAAKDHFCHDRIVVVEVPQP
jgi:hypothetical protein